MTKIFLPSSGPSDWQRLLAEPKKHWKPGYSARNMAYSWEENTDLPPEIAALFAGSSAFEHKRPELLLALPEYKVPLPGGSSKSQNDVFAIIRCADQTISTTVEGKVDEPFGPTLGEWMADASEGKKKRLDFLRDLLGLPEDLPEGLHYQLLHRTGSAVIEARRFKTDAAAMIVHSFSREGAWFDAYVRFLEILGLRGDMGQLASTQLPGGMPLHLGWAAGDPRFLEA